MDKQAKIISFLPSIGLLINTASKPTNPSTRLRTGSAASPTTPTGPMILNRN